MATSQSNMQFVNDFSKIQRTNKLISNQVQEKLVAALQFAAKSSIYNLHDAIIDLSCSQSLLLSILYGFYSGDLQLVMALIEVSSLLVQLKSSYLKVWLRDDFNFKKEDVIEVFTRMDKMRETGLFRLPVVLSEAFAVLVEKYKLVEYCRERMDISFGSFVSSFIHDDKDDFLTIAGVPAPSRALVESFSSLSEGELQASLRKAVHNNELTTIIALIDLGANIDDELDNGDTLLHLAVSNCNVGAVRLLLKYGAMPNWRNRDYITPLQMAVALNNCKIVEALVRSGAKVNQPSSEGYTLLHEAALKGNTEVLKVLVGLGSSIDRKSINGQTPLHLATKGNHLATVEALLEVGADVNVLSDNGEAPIHIAVSAGYSKILKCLIRSGADLSIKTKNGMTVLHLARNKHIVKILNTGGANANFVSDAGDTPLHCAALDGSLEIAKAFIASNADIDCLNSKKATPLSIALKAEKSEMVKLLVASGANVNFKDKEDSENTLLHWAVQEGKLNCVQLLLDARVDVNIKNAHNNTPLHYAASSGNYTITELLINKGADVNISNNKGETPYRFAALNGHLEVAKLLLDKGAKTSSIDINADVNKETTSSNRVFFRFGSSSLGDDQEASGAAKPNPNPLTNSPDLQNKSSNTTASFISPSFSFSLPSNASMRRKKEVPEPVVPKTIDPSQSIFSAPVAPGVSEPKMPIFGRQPQPPQPVTQSSLSNVVSGFVTLDPKKTEKPGVKKIFR